MSDSPAGKFSLSLTVVVRVLDSSGCDNEGGMLSFVFSSVPGSVRSPWCFLWLLCLLYGFTFSTCFGTAILKEMFVIPGPIEHCFTYLSSLSLAPKPTIQNIILCITMYDCFLTVLSNQLYI